VFTFTWFLPLIVMVGSYLTIIIIIYRRSRLFKKMTEDGQVGCRTTSSQGVIGRAKIQTIKVTGVLVCGFIVCWTPYNVMSFW
jgi:gonadotropin-releasing hormone receptor